MSITDELRAWANEHLHKSGIRSDLLTIADRIDAEHERAMSRAGQLLADAEKDRDYNYANWQECKQKVLQHNITIDELYARIECLEDELSHCIELPKDADGVPIHVGDRLRNDSGKEVTVVGVGDGTFFTFFSVGVNHAHYAADFRHAKPDSWERIVQDAIDGLCDEDELVARCKALAGEK